LVGDDEYSGGQPGRWGCGFNQRAFRTPPSGAADRVLVIGTSLCVTPRVTESAVCSCCPMSGQYRTTRQSSPARRSAAASASSARGCSRRGASHDHPARAVRTAAVRPRRQDSDPAVRDLLTAVAAIDTLRPALVRGYTLSIVLHTGTLHVSLLPDGGELKCP
jgi:hypothetical protein